MASPLIANNVYKAPIAACSYICKIKMTPPLLVGVYLLPPSVSVSQADHTQVFMWLVALPCSIHSRDNSLHAGALNEKMLLIL